MNTPAVTSEVVLACVRAHARLAVAWAERLWSERETSLDQGLAITSGEVRRILRDPTDEHDQYRRFADERENAALASAAQTASQALAGNPFWSHLANTFALSAPELDLLCLLAAVELDPPLGRVLAYIADDTRATLPTLVITAALFRRPLAASLPNLVRWRLAHPLDGLCWQARSTWQIDESVMSSLLSGSWQDPVGSWQDPWLARVCSIIQGADALPCLYPELLSAMRDSCIGREVGFDVRREDMREVTLVGPAGSGRATLAAQYAATLGQSLLVVDTASLLALVPSSFACTADALVAAARRAHASDALLYWRDADPSDDPDPVRAADWAMLRPLVKASFRASVPHARPAAGGAGRLTLTLPALPTARRLEVWAVYSHQLAASRVLSEQLTPAEIKAAARSAADTPATPARPSAATRHDTDLLHGLACPYSWDDLVVSGELRRTLLDFEAQVRLRWQVYEEWGFARLTHLGRGISALFNGPSGTGKTMAAQVLARSLGVELFRVDLAGVVSKYIGETEKRLRDVFNASERSGAILFFDEADALFGKRMPVKEAHDRFSNIEIDYLLQRIEQFDGISILATNRKNDLEPAFFRRLRFVVDFLPPGRPERLLLWHKALPPCAPSGEPILGEIDFALLSSELDINGAAIKSIALGAAFLARAEGARIELRHIDLAAQRELAKSGLRLRPLLERTAARQTAGDRA